MDIIKNINIRLTYEETDICPGGGEKIKMVKGLSPVELPNDYIELLKSISGEGNYGIAFKVDNKGHEISIWSADMALMKYEEFNIPATEDFLNTNWLLGDDLGDLVYFYGNGEEGFGLYRCEAGHLGHRYAEKIADSITKFLVDGIGIDIAITL